MKLFIIILLGTFALTGCGDDESANTAHSPEGEAQVDENSVAEETPEPDVDNSSTPTQGDGSTEEETSDTEAGTQSVNCTGENNQSITFTFRRNTTNCGVVARDQNDQTLNTYFTTILGCLSDMNKVLNGEKIQISPEESFENHVSMQCSK